jgi:hypothetical protein
MRHIIDKRTTNIQFVFRAVNSNATNNARQHASLGDAHQNPTCARIVGKESFYVQSGARKGIVYSATNRLLSLRLAGEE